MKYVVKRTLNLQRSTGNSYKVEPGEFVTDADLGASAPMLTRVQWIAPVEGDSSESTGPNTEALGQAPTLGITTSHATEKQALAEAEKEDKRIQWMAQEEGDGERRRKLRRRETFA